MSEIGDLYDAVMAGEMDKVAEDMSGGGFWEKVASGDEDANEEVNAFIDEAREAGYDDEQIAAALDEAMEDESEGGYEGDDFEEAKHAAWADGFDTAIDEALIMAKQAGYDVDYDDLAEYDLGGAYGSGYAEGRQYADEAIEKIAKIGPRMRIARSAGRQLKADIKGAGKYLWQGGKKGRGGIKGYGKALAGGRGAKGWERLGGKKGQRLSVWGARAGTAGALGGGAYLVSRRRRRR